MVSEAVTITVLKENVTVDFGTTSREVGQARISATFNMCNMGTHDEQMDVRFPLQSVTGDGYGSFPEIRDLIVKVDGNQVKIYRIESPTPPTPDYKKKYDGPWAAFPVHFPVGKQVQMEVNYTTYGATVYPFTRFSYLLETGAGWYDTIDKADLIMRLPYAANLINTTEDMTNGGFFIGREIRWHYDNLEPTRDNNLDITILLPIAWNKVLIEEENVLRNPIDGEAWGRLGKAYKEAIQEHHGIRCDQGGKERDPKKPRCI